VMGWTYSSDRTSEKHTGGQGPLGKLRQTEIWIGLNLNRIMLLTLFQLPVTLAGHPGCHIHKQQAAGCHRVSSASSGLISRALQFIQLRPWPGRLVFPNRHSVL
jgi:hypothetical protein